MNAKVVRQARVSASGGDGITHNLARPDKYARSYLAGVSFTAWSIFQVHYTTNVQDYRWFWWSWLVVALPLVEMPASAEYVGPSGPAVQLQARQTGCHLVVANTLYPIL